MSDKTGIEWTEATWNPVTGCTKVSQGCKNCYALRDWARMSANPKTVYYGREFTDVQRHPERLDQPLRWSKPRLIFVNSMSDLFHESVPDDFIEQVFGVMALAKQHTFQILTKRPDRARQWLSKATMAVNDRDPSALVSFFPQLAGCIANPEAHHTFPLPNVWLGVSVEDQAAADERIPLLLQTPAAVRWISAEPLLGPIDLTSIKRTNADGYMRPLDGRFRTLDWVVVGGESGPNARPMSIRWARSLRDQCESSSVPFLFKQWGEWAPAGLRKQGESGRFAFGDYEHDQSKFIEIDHYPREFTKFGSRCVLERVGKKAAGRLLDGVEHNGYPMVNK